MVLSRSLVNYFFKFSNYRIYSQTLILSLTLRRFYLSQCQWEKRFGTSAAKFEKQLPPALFKYEMLSDETAPTDVLDVEEERQKITTEKEVDNRFEEISLKRGITGVIDVEELVELLKREKGEDILVLKVPPEYNYADFKVIVTGRSQRHMLAMADLTRKLYKKRVSLNQVPKLEGKNSKTWMALDFGNIILHVFSAAGRQLYDLETLWLVGKDYDNITHCNDNLSHDITDYAKILASLTPKSEF